MKYPFWPDIKGFRDIKFGLDRVLELSKRLDNVHLKLPSVIHVAGTNGKGSTLAFLQAICNENNIKVNKYTSPHLVNFNERIILNHNEISDDFLTYCLKECQKMANIKPKIDLTFFEGVTIAAFLAFSIEKSDILLVETGMGGVLDATNIIPKILAAIITPISMDHQAYLGDNISKIAENKAGIIKENCPVTTYQNFNEAFNVIKKQAKLKKSNLIHIVNEGQDISDNFVNNNIFYVGSKDKFWYLKNSNLNLKLLKPNLIGDFQLINASLAITTLITQKKFQIAPDSLSKAITKVNWPGRMQKINCGKLYNLLPTNSELYIDGAHNEMSAVNIAKFIDDQKSNNKIAIIAMLKDKDSSNFIKAIANSFDLIICSEIHDEPSSLPCHELKNIAQKYHGNVCAINNISKAFNYINNNFSKQGNLIILSGSLYLIGEFLECN